MKKIYNFMKLQSLAMLFVAVAMVGCNVDDAYDLSKLDTEDVGIGTDDTSFDLPLAEMTFNVEELVKSDDSGDDGGDGFQTKADVVDDSDSDSSSEGVIASDMLSTVNDLSMFLPDTYGAIELDRLSEEEYAGELTDALLLELSEDADRSLDFCIFIVEEQESYPTVFGTMVDVLPGYDIYDTESFAEAFNELLNDSEGELLATRINSAITDTIVVESADFVMDFLISEVFEDSIDIDSSTMDMIDSNLDGDKNTLSILYILTTDLPVSMTFEPYVVLSDDTRIRLSDYTNDTDITTLITADNFRDMLSQLKVEVEVEFSTYDPADGDLDLSSKNLTVKLIARKTGSLKF